MTKHMQTLVMATLLSVRLGTDVGAQNQSPPSSAPPTAVASAPAVLTPLKVQVVIARYQGEKKISSLPYTLSVNANGDGSRLRMGGRIPVVMTGFATGGNGPQPIAGGPVQYQNIGTNIDCSAATLDGGRFKLHLIVSDESVYPDDQASPGSIKGNPSFRSFSSDETLILRDGQTTQLTTATDKVNGEVTKIEVTLTVVK